MSTIDDSSELRDSVAASLKAMGVLGKIKAQLRSNIYLAFEGENQLKTKSRELNSKLDDFVSTSDGRIILNLVREFLEFFDLDFTLSVFEPEAMDGRCPIRSRKKLEESLGFAETLRSDLPLLSEVLKLSKVTVLRSETPTEEISQNHSEEQTSIIDESQKLISNATPMQSLTPESSLSNVGINRMAADLPDTSAVNATETKTSEPSKASGSVKSVTEVPKLSSQSFLSDLPPLTLTTRSSPVKLAPLKKVNSFEKPVKENQEVSSVSTFMSTPKSTSTQPEKVTSNSSLDEDEIEEEMDEFLNSDVSASEDFTKDEAASEAASLQADYTEQLP